MTDGIIIGNDAYYTWPIGTVQSWWPVTATTATWNWQAWPQPVMTGWVCPRCEKVWAPSTPGCDCLPAGNSGELPEADCD